MRALIAFVGLLSAAAAIARFAMWWSARKARGLRDKVFEQMDQWRNQDDSEVTHPMTEGETHERSNGNS